MSLIMYDSIYVASIPADAAAAAGYVDGTWPTILELKAKLPHAHILSIAAFAVDDADCLDVEQFDATPAEAPGWVKRQQGRGIYRPAVYASVSNVPAVLTALRAAGISRSEVRIWSAHYTGVTHICGPSTCAFPGLTINCDGTQFTDASHGLPLDASLLLADFFDGPPKPPPRPHAGILQGDDMAFLPNGAGVVATLLVPAAVPQPDGSFKPPKVLRLATNAPCAVSTQQGPSAPWTADFAIDFSRGPNSVTLDTPLPVEVKVKRVDGGANFVTADFA